MEIFMPEKRKDCLFSVGWLSRHIGGHRRKGSKRIQSVRWRGRPGGLKVLSLCVKPGLKPEAVLYFLTVRSHKFFLFCLSYFELLFCLLQPNAFSCLPKPTTVSEGLHRPCLIISFTVVLFVSLFKGEHLTNHQQSPRMSPFITLQSRLTSDAGISNTWCCIMNEFTDLVMLSCYLFSLR